MRHRRRSEEVQPNGTVHRFGRALQGEPFAERGTPRSAGGLAGILGQDSAPKRRKNTGEAAGAPTSASASGECVWGAASPHDYGRHTTSSRWVERDGCIAFSTEQGPGKQRAEPLGPASYSVTPLGARAFASPQGLSPRRSLRRSQGRPRRRVASASTELVAGQRCPILPRGIATSTTPSLPCQRSGATSMHPP